MVNKANLHQLICLISKQNKNNKNNKTTKKHIVLEVTRSHKAVDKVAPTWKAEDRVPQKHLRIDIYIRFINYFIYINVYKTLNVKMLICVSTHYTYLKQYFFLS